MPSSPPPPPDASSTPLSPLALSSYLSPSRGPEVYGAARERTVARATAMGYDPASMTEHGVVWADDQDPFGHVANATFPRYVSCCGFRLFESFAAQLGPAAYQDLLRARGIGVIVREYSLEIRRPVRYPDALVAANRITEVRPDRYHCVTSIWSLAQEAVACESRGWVVFFDYRTRKPADLVAAGGVHADLYHALAEKARLGREKAEAWDKANPKKGKGGEKGKPSSKL